MYNVHCIYSRLLYRFIRRQQHTPAVAVEAAETPPPSPTRQQHHILYGVLHMYVHVYIYMYHLNAYKLEMLCVRRPCAIFTHAFFSSSEPFIF